MNYTLLAVIPLLLSCNKSSINDSTTEHIDNRSEYSDAINVSTPESFELFNIAISLTDYGLDANGYVNKNSDYYNKVQSYFGNYKNHPFIKLIKQFCDLNYAKGSDMIPNYNNIKEASVFINLNGDSLTVNPEAKTLLPDSLQYFIKQFMLNANSFLRDSKFIKFYNDNKPIYQDAAIKFKMAIPAKAIWNWLESKFDIKYEKYMIPLSPLTGGSHFNFPYILSDKTICMVVIGPSEYISSKVDEGHYSLYLFTEIDHEYVNPTSNKYIDQINSAFGNLHKWNTGIYYSTPYDTFNEYMTWAVFTLYAYERYNESDFQKINQGTVDIMKNNRGFIKFDSFNNEMLTLYKNKKAGETIQDLYSQILQWAKIQ
jgi:hypothetical protein